MDKVPIKALIARDRLLSGLHYFTGLLLVVGDTGLLDVRELLDGFHSGLLHSGLLHLGLLDGFDSGLLHSGHRIFVGLIL